MRRDIERVQDISEAINLIDRYAQQGQDSFEQNELIQVWIVHHLQIIGEATRSISEQFKVQHSEVPWPKIAGLRNLIIHEYFRVDPDIVWDIVQNDLPHLKQQIEEILQDLTNPNP